MEWASLIYLKMISILKKFDYIIEKCFVFGSRARGDYSSGSDVDLAIVTKHQMGKDLYKVSQAFEESSLIYSVDIINYNSISNNLLKEEIDRVGKVIYWTQNGSDLIMEQNQLKMKYYDLQKASSKLQDVLVRDYQEDSIVIDATIQRFEFTFELSWKLLKAMLEYDGFENVASPRKAIREGFKQGYIEDGSAWLKMLDDRNRTSHTYDEEKAIEILIEIKGQYMDLINKFVSSAGNELQE